jgi:hypothetical protein
VENALKTGNALSREGEKNDPTVVGAGSDSRSDLRVFGVNACAALWL